MSLTSSNRTALTASAWALAGMAAAAMIVPSRHQPQAPPPIGTASTAHPAPGTPAGDLSAAAAASLKALIQADTAAGRITAALGMEAIDDPDDIRRLLDRSGSFPASPADALATGMLLKRWVALDPDAAARYCRIHIPAHLPFVIAQWAGQDPGKAEDFYHNLPADLSKPSILLFLINAVATTDPTTAVRLLVEETPATPGVQALASHALRRLAEKDINLVIANIEKLPSELMRSQARFCVASKLIADDIDQGWAWVRSNPPLSFAGSYTMMGFLLDEIARKDLDKALTLMAELPAEQRRAGAVVGGNHPPAAMVAALGRNTALPMEEKQQVALRGFESMSGRDPVGSEVFLPWLPPAMIPSAMGQYVAARVAGTSRAETEAWLAGLPTGPLRSAAEAAWQQLPPTKPMPAAGSAKAFIPAEFARSVRGNQEDPRLAALTMAELSAVMTDPKAPFLSYLAGAMGLSNPALFSSWLASAPVTGNNVSCASRFSAAWADQDPAAAAAWVRSLPSGPIAVEAAKLVSRQYRRHDPAAAAAWVGNLPPGSVQDAARAAMSAQ